MVMKKRGYIVRLEDAISVTTHIKSEADYVYGYEKRGYIVRLEDATNPPKANITTSDI